MTKAVRIILTLCALAVTAAVAAGCGGVPGNAVADVDGSTIDKAEFNHWLNVASKSSGTNSAVPDPPNFTKCVATKTNSTSPDHRRSRCSMAAILREDRGQRSEARGQGSEVRGQGTDHRAQG